MSSITPHGTVTSDGLTVTIDDIRGVEERAARAWPETDHRMLGGWRLRHSPGVPNRRANSVLPIYPPVTENVQSGIADVEAFYGRHGLPSRFMISPASMPVDLDRVLEEQGYHIDAPTDVQWADREEVGQRAAICHDVKMSTGPDLDWMGVYMEGVTDRHEIERKTELIHRIGAESVLARIDVDERPVCVGLGVHDTGWTGVFCMHTLSDHRWQGYARSVLGALAAWARDRGDRNMYLQVERSNPGARAFYEQSGFGTRYGYHYRTRET